ncbi:hypothetical protein N0V82_002579 [Gnomoniopsis sp. IMI 355080]|nr:hypothetical protein N0V82_002579 [Gnomoniopsis sp. IMI 355080]
MTVEDPGAPPADNGEFWLFGYGYALSLHLIRPNYILQDHRGTPEKPGRVVTLIEQSFWKTLQDVHQAPTDGKVWGVALRNGRTDSAPSPTKDRIKHSHVAEVKEYLDIREINGYSIHYAPFHPAPTPSSPHLDPIRTLVYIGTPDNDQFTGPQDIDALAAHIYRSEGPSGLNRAYLLSLDESLRELSPESGDEHITDLAERVRAIIAREEGRAGAEVGNGAGGQSEAVSGEKNENAAAAARNGFSRRESVDEQEETEKIHRGR